MKTLSSPTTSAYQLAVSHVENLQTLVQKRVLDHLKRFDIPVPEQFVFCAGHSYIYIYNMTKRNSFCVSWRLLSKLVALPQTIASIFNIGIVFASPE